MFTKRLLRVLFALCLVCFAAAASAQSLNQGSFSGNTYTNSFFQISLTLPANLKPKTQAQTRLSAPSSYEAWMLFAAQQDPAPFGIVMITQLLRPNGISSAKDFLRRVRNTLGPGDVVQAEEHRVSSHGLAFDWLDWKAVNGELDSAVVLRRDNYLLVARCSAKTGSDLQAMKNALFDTRVLAK